MASVYRTAPTWKRVVARLADLALMIVLFVIGWVVLVVVLAKRGQTPGKAMVGIRVVAADGEPLPAARIVVRELALKELVGVLTFELSSLLGVVQLLWDRRPWWDRVLGSIVVDSRPVVSHPNPTSDVRSAMNEPVPFEVYEAGGYLHGTKADLAIGEMLMPGRESNFEEGRVMNHVYFTATLDAATWGAELAAGEGRGRIYVVEPTGEFEDDPNLTDKKFPGNPTQSFRSRHPLRVVGELTEWVGHSPEKLQAMRDGLDAMKQQGSAQIED